LIKIALHLHGNGHKMENTCSVHADIYCFLHRLDRSGESSRSRILG